MRILDFGHISWSVAADAAEVVVVRGRAVVISTAAAAAAAAAAAVAAAAVPCCCCFICTVFVRMSEIGSHSDQATLAYTHSGFERAYAE